MSYCRWSSDDFQCDLYCYAAVGGGYVTHVAAMKRILKEELPPPIEFNDDPDGWVARNGAVIRIAENADLVPIGLPCDGKCYTDETLAEFRDRVACLIDVGYRAPSYVLETIDKEIAESGIC